MRIVILSFLFCWAIIHQGFSQNNQIDSLQSVLTKLSAEQDPNMVRIANTQKELGLALYNQRQFASALEQYKLAAEAFRKLKDDVNESECLHNLGNISYFLGSYQEAISQYKSSIDIREKLNEQKGLATGYNNLANVYNRLGDYPLAIGYYEKSLKVKEAINDQKGIASTLKNIASIYYYQDNYVPALETNLQALRISEELQDSTGISFVFNNIALIYEKQEKLDEALDYFQRSLTIKEALQDEQGISVTLNNIGNLYLKQKKYQDALAALNSSLSISEKIGEKEGISAALNNIARAYEEQGDIQEALVFYQKSMEIDQEIMNKRGILISVSSLAHIHQSLKNYRLSTKYANEGVNLAKELGAKAELRDLNETLAKNHEALGQFKDALYHYQLYHAYADSVFNQEIEKQTARLEAEYEYDKKLAIFQAEQKALDLENEKEIQRQNFQKRILILSLFGLMIIASVIFFNYRKQKKAKILLQVKTDELEKANQVKSKLFSIIGHDLRGPIGSLYMLLGLYRKNQMEDEEFKQLVPELYKNVGAILEVLNNLLRWSMGEMNMIKSEPKTILLSQKATELLNFFSTLSQQKLLRIQNLIPEDIAVIMDPNHLELILRNLLNNAIKFSNKGGQITISAKEQEDMVTVAIQDEGLGMSQEEVGKLFQNTLADSKRGTTGEQGTGLGLNLCQLYIEKSGGKIWVESEPDKGSVFYFSLKKASVNTELVP